MDELTLFEQRFEKRVRSFAANGVRPVDSAAVAHALVIAAERARPAGQWLALQHGRRAWTTAFALALVAVLLGAALLVGARLLVPPPSVTNGWIAFTAAQPAAGGL